MTETEANLREIFATLFKAGPERKGGSRRKSKLPFYQQFQLQVKRMYLMPVMIRVI